MEVGDGISFAEIHHTDDGYLWLEVSLGHVMVNLAPAVIYCQLNRKT